MMTKMADWKFENNIYEPKDIDKLFEGIEFIKSNKRIEYANVPCVIDIETSSFYEDEEKRAIQYAFVFGINGKCIIGRYMWELILLLDKTKEHFDLWKDKRIIFYVHNLSYEFQWFRKHFKWEKVFSVEERKPLYAMTEDGIELRCSYLLSGYSLEKVGENLTKYKVNKMVGDLDYKLLRTPLTPLTDKELGYILNDGLVVMCYIQEQIESHHYNISYLPLTKTGEVRNYCRKNCFYQNNSHKKGVIKFTKYHKMMENLPVVDIDEYKQLKRAFHGGFTHANAIYVNTIQENVASYDFTSSYPAVMISEKFPMMKGKLIKLKDKEDFYEKLKLYCCLFDIEFFDIEASTSYDHPISISKCFICEGETNDNGRLVRAKHIKTTLTEQDFYTIREFYTWSKMKITKFRIYKKNYLPRDFVLSILNLYKKKTELKGVEGKEVEYLVSKEGINSTFGMCVTDILRDETIYEDDLWSTEIPTDEELEKALNKYNHSKRRFLCYQWGVWVTAYAQRNLFTGIKEFGTDYMYSDTDSLKVLNYQDHQKYIDNYNRGIKIKIIKALSYNNIDISMAHPKTIKGVEKWLGVWDFEGCYKHFVTLGAKRYMVENEEGFKYIVDKKYIERNNITNYELLKNDKYKIKLPFSLTISGVNKQVAIPYLYEKFNGKVLENFKDGLYIPKGFTGKNIHTYIDEETSGKCVDYMGKEYQYHELSSIHMEECDYELSLTREFLDFIMEIQDDL